MCIAERGGHADLARFILIPLVYNVHSESYSRHSIRIREAPVADCRR